MKDKLEAGLQKGGSSYESLNDLTEFISQLPSMVQEVKVDDPATSELVYTSKVTILKVDFNSQLHYKACPKCQRKVTFEGSNFVCNACNQNVEYPKLRYMLKVLVSDATGSAWFVIFDQEAERIIEHKLSFVLEEFNKIGGTDNQYQPEASSSQIPISITDDSNQQHFNTLHMNHSSEGSTKTTEEGNPHKKICMRR
ncbi:replication protein A 70 kDa DNA-binding subunit D-like [Coffea eugenioides]|uniref:replication protein A 70 kDa DNA-binding subunit D-like n=1 Tax=Coffea eugenioides TaxID=49369 RepID=UPI000F614535|nr:replication protein A 70 kDa DNA-binding subunit D-like [Coffea eugenioides]